jgi:hypothetical protein
MAAAIALLSGCGVPTGAAPERIAASDVPYGLAEPAQSTPAPVSAPPAADDPRVYFVAADDRLVPRGRDVGTGPRDDRLADLLAALATGPTEDERAEQLSTALQPGVELTASDVENGVVTIDLSGTEGTQSPEESRRAVGQIVLTATSVPGIDAVLLTAAGERVDAPLPTGELTSRPLTAADYEVLLTGPPAPSVTHAPLSSQVPPAPVTSTSPAPSAVPAPGPSG